MLDFLTKVFQSMAKDSASAIQEVETTADLVYHKAATMENIVGSSDVMAELKHAYPTMWASIATISEDLIREQSIKSAPVPLLDLSGLRSEITAGQDTMTASTTKIRGFITSFTKSILKRVAGAEEDIKKLVPLRLGNQASTDNGDEFDHLLSAVLGSRVGQPASGHQESNLSLKVDDQRLLDLEYKLDQMLISNQELETRLVQIIAGSEVGTWTKVA